MWGLGFGGLGFGIQDLRCNVSASGRRVLG